LTFDDPDPTASHFNLISGGSVGQLGDASTVLDDFAISFRRIAPLWQDLDPSAGGAVNLRSSADRLVVTWSDVPLFRTTTRLTFQVILFSSGVIHFNYQSVGSTPGGGYLVGISPGGFPFFGPFAVTTVDFSQGGQTVSNDPEEEPLAQVFGTTSAPLVHISAVARRFYASHSDDYDQLLMFANFTHAMGGAFAYEVSPKNDVEGIGVETYDSARLFGSPSRLQSFVNLNRLSLYPSSPTTNISGLGTNNTLDVIGQEAGHRWLAFTQFDNGSITSDELLGRDKAHWSFFLDSDASDMEGNNWQDNGNGTFTSNEATSRYSSLDQYAMGLRSAPETPDFFFVANPSLVNCPVYDSEVGERSCPPQLGVTVSGQRQDVAVDEIIAAEGTRQPESGFSNVNPSTTWKQAFILLVKTSTAPSTDLTKIGNIRSAWVPYFKSAVSNLGTVDTLLPGGEPSLQFSAANSSVSESAGTATITVTRTGSTAEAVTVDYATSNGTATAGSDYSATNGTLNFNGGESSKTFAVTISNDTRDETDETVNLTLSNPTGGAVLGAQKTSVLTIIDDDTGGTLQFNAATYSVNETGGSATITVTRTGGIASNVTVAYATSNGSATADSDYTANSGTLTFNAGDTSKTFSVVIANDSSAEGNETVNLTLSNPTGGATLGAISAAVLTIVDDEMAINFSAANFTVAESTKSATITVSRSGPTTTAVTVDYATSNGTANAGSDYTGVSGTLTFAAGQASRTFTIPIINDTLDENSETVNLSLSNPTGGAQLGTQNTAVLTITDDDTGGTLQFSAAAYSASETKTPVTITVKRTGGSASGVTVDYTTSNGTAIAGVDYTATSGTLTFGSGQTSRTFTVPIINDTIDDGNRTVLLALSNPTGGASLGALNGATLTVSDNDTGGTVQFSAATYSVNESSGSAVITVSRSGGSASNVTVDYSTSNGTATAGLDYGSASGTLTFSAGETSKQFSVTISEDALTEGNEIVNLTLSNPTGGAVLGARASANLTIVDND
jgi:hypothetical protein